ncbi:MAG: hypothetical protein ABI852_11535 [Gemmatimonadaceae bacterium]
MHLRTEKLFRILSCAVALATVGVAAAHAQTTAVVKPEQTLQEMAAQSAAVSPEITLKVTQNDKEMVLSFGPIELSAHAGHHGGVPEPPPRWITIPEDVWIHGYWVELLDKNGAKVPMSTLHHVNVLATQQRELFSNIMLRIAAASAETEPVKLPRLVGLDAHKGDTLLVRAMLHNTTEKSYEGVRVLVHFPTTKRNSTIGSLRIQPFYLDVTAPAGPHAFNIAVGHSEQYWDANPAVNVRILGFTGHVHKYATTLRFEDRTSGKVIWEVHPEMDANGEPKAIPLKRYFFPTFGLGIRADHTYRLTVVYDNPTGATIVDGGMGTLGGVVMVGGGTKWPSVDPKSPEYKLDIWAMWRP